MKAYRGECEVYDLFLSLYRGRLGLARALEIGFKF